MSVSNEIARIRNNISSTYDVLEEKGATIPNEKNSNNLADTARTITSGIDTTSDNPVTASDMVEGKEAFVNGNKIIGNVVYENYEHYTNEVLRSGSDEAMRIGLLFGSNNGKRMIGDGKYMRVYTTASNFGNATTANVVKGFTFTSADGLKVEGSLEEWTGGIY